MIFQNESEENFNNLFGKEHVQLLNCKIGDEMKGCLPTSPQNKLQ